MTKYNKSITNIYVKQWVNWVEWLKKFALHVHCHCQSIIPVSVPFQRHILQEPSDVLGKVLNPSQTAEKK